MAGRGAAAGAGDARRQAVDVAVQQAAALTDTDEQASVPRTSHTGVRPRACRTVGERARRPEAATEVDGGTAAPTAEMGDDASAAIEEVDGVARSSMEEVDDEANSSYYTWKTYFSLVFREYHLVDHVDGTVDSSLVPDFHEWSTIDTTIIRWFFLTISPDPFQAQEFFGCHQDNTSVDDYCRRLKTLTDELRDIGAKIDDDLLLTTLTAGLNEDFGNAAANLSLIPNPSFAKFIVYLRLEEQRMKQVKARAIHTALAAGTTHGGSSAPPAAPAAPLPQRHLAPLPYPAPQQSGLLPLPYGSPAPPAERRRGGRRGGGHRGGQQQQPQGAGQPRQQQQQQFQVPPPWASGYNPWTSVVHTHTMPVPRAPGPTLPVPRPSAHQAYYAAPQPYGGYPLLQLSGAYGLPAAPPPPLPALPPAPWDPVLLAALHTAPTPNNYTGGGDWYMDTGATAHMFAYPDNLASFTPVTTDRRIIVGDGSTLPITHVGHTSFPSNSMPITLSNILLSPHLIKNLVFVRCLTRENPVTVEFDEPGFCVKDARTRMHAVGHPILALQTDNGKEFDNLAFRTFLSHHGTVFRLTCSYPRLFLPPPVTWAPRLLSQGAHTPLLARPLALRRAPRMQRLLPPRH
nr:uncharacterized protein LOC109755549 [Aegilops tauschii subsp. strangulata]